MLRDPAAKRISGSAIRGKPHRDAETHRVDDDHGSCSQPPRIEDWNAIEHHPPKRRAEIRIRELRIAALADWMIDLGPEGGNGGGTVVAMGTPEDVAAVEGSWTGKYLRGVLSRQT